MQQHTQTHTKHIHEIPRIFNTYKINETHTKSCKSRFAIMQAHAVIEQITYIIIQQHTNTSLQSIENTYTIMLTKSKNQNMHTKSSNKSYT